MHIRLPTLALAASLLACPYAAYALNEQEIPADIPVSSLLSSAQSHLSRGETSEALLYYDAAATRDPSNYLTFFKRATTYLSLGRVNQATDDFNTVLTLKPGFEGAHVQLAKIRTKVGDWDGAREQFKLGGKAKSAPEMVELAEAEGGSALGLAAEKSGDWEACVGHLGTALALAPRAAPLRESRAHCRVEMGVLDEAIADLQHLLHLRPGDITPYVQIAAMSFYSLGNIENGMGYTRKCLHSDPDSKPCKQLLRQQKQVDKALGKVLKSLEINRPSAAVKVLVDSGDESGLVTDIEAQVEELRQQGRIPAKGQVELHTKVLELTCQAYYEVSRWSPTCDGIVQAQRLTILRKQMNSKKASQACKRALEVNEDSFYGLLLRGKEYHEAEDFEAAIRSFEKAAEVRPDKQGAVRSLLDKAKVALKRSKTKDYYKVLGVAHDADDRQIKSAYRKASKQYHPDKAAHQGITKEQAQKKMAAVNEAYEVLSTPELRARFDRGDDPNDPSGQSSPFGGSPFGGGGGGGGGHPFFFQQGAGGGRGHGSQKFQFHFNGF